MTLQIIDQSFANGGVYLTATAGNVTGFCSVRPAGVTVTCLNAAHRVWRKSGRSFPNVPTALAAYKSGEMKAIIQAAAAAAGASKT